MPTNFTRKTYVDFTTPVVDAQWLNGMQEKADTTSTLFTDFGAVGDGVTDDTAAVSAALADPSYVLDGAGLTYKISSSLTSTVAHKIKNATFVGTSGIATQQPIIKFTGSIGAGVDLTVDSLADTYTATVTSASTFSPEQWVRINSTDEFAPNENVTNGELVRIKSIVSNVLTFYTPLGLAYTTTASGKVFPITMLENVSVESCKFICNSGTDNGIGLELNYCSDVTLYDVWSQDADYSHHLYYQCADVNVFGGKAERTGTSEGLDYGIVVSGPCYNVNVFGWTSLDVRHGITIGSLTTSGVGGVSRWVTVSNCHVSGALNAGIDAHPPVLEHSFLYNTVSFSADVTSTGDGIISQGARPILIGNTITGGNRHGIFYQPDIALGATTLACIIKDNIGVTTDASAASSGRFCYAVTDFTAPCAVISSVIITNNIGQGWSRLAEVYAKSASIIRVIVNENHNITDNSARSILIRADNGVEVSTVEVNGNVASTTSSDGLFLFGNGTGRIKNARISSNRITGGSVATFRVENCDNLSVDALNQFSGGTKPYSVDTASTGVSIDNRRSSIVTVAASSYTVLEQDQEIIVNNGALCTLTLPSPAVWTDREFFIKTIQAFGVNNNSSNIVQIDSTTTAATILAGTDGAWCRLRSNGTNWVIMARG